MSKTVTVKDIQVILCDIEDNLSNFLLENVNQKWFCQFLQDHMISKENLEQEIRRLMSVDSKISWLKKFQGLMWEHAYHNYKLKGQVYSDFPDFLCRNSEKFRIGIYSSGSIQAQKLLFSFTENDGNLLQHLKFHFDTTIGLKTLPNSYTLISQELQVEPREILFLSDSILEIEAASKAGLKTLRVDRAQKHTCNGVVHSFDEVDVIRKAIKLK